MRLKNLIVLVAVVILLLVLKFVFFPSKGNEPAPAQKGKGVPANISAFVVVPSKLSNEVYASGTVLANEEVLLQPELSGKVIDMNFQEGSKVSKGQLLVKINDADLQAQFKRLKLQHTLAEEKMSRQKKLLDISGISQEEYDVAVNQYEVIRADMDFASAQIAKTEIRAPFDGVIGLKRISTGAYVTPSTIIATLQQVNPVKIDFSVSERYSSLVKKGDKVTFTVEGIKDKMTAEVFAIEPKIDMSTRSLQIRALCSNRSESVFPGAFVKVQLALTDIDSALMIPTQAIVPDLKGQKVYRVKNGKAETAKVETGLRTDTKIQVTSGIAAGDTVAITGIMQLRPGAAVKITDITK
jgi:membrane fusion protein (multidrug efflux system)